MATEGAPWPPGFLDTVRAVGTDPRQRVEEVLEVLTRLFGIPGTTDPPSPSPPPPTATADRAALHRHLAASGLLVPYPDLRRKYDGGGGDDMDVSAAAECKAKEFLVQAALRLHLAGLAPGAADPLPDAALGEVVALLQAVAVSFADGFPAALGMVLGPFATPLPLSMREVYERLEVAVPPALRTPDDDDDDDGEVDHFLHDGPRGSDAPDPEGPVRPRSPSPVTPASAAPLHPLLSRKRSLSLGGSGGAGGGGDADADGCGGSQQSAASDTRPPQKRTVGAMALQVLRALQSPSLRPEPVDPSSGRAPCDALYSGGLCLLRTGSRGAAPRPRGPAPRAAAPDHRTVTGNRRESKGGPEGFRSPPGPRPEVSVAYSPTTVQAVALFQCLRSRAPPSGACDGPPRPDAAPKVLSVARSPFGPIANGRRPAPDDPSARPRPRAPHPLGPRVFW